MQLETVGEIVRVLRARRRLEQVELARACGWRDASAVSRIETDRIRPTRRTLVRLADSLADPDVPGSAAQVRSWLFYASGILPTAEEVRALGDAIPEIERWTQPALVIDMAWHVWRANTLFSRMLGLPDDVIGRNFLELFFEPGGSVRGRVGEYWERGALQTLRQFRAENDRRARQRWYSTLVGRLERMPDFARLWHLASPRGPEEVAARFRQTTSIGTLALLRLPLTADPRLSVMHVVPEDAEGTLALLQQAELL